MGVGSLGIPGIKADRTATKRVFTMGNEIFSRVSSIIDGAFARDAGNTGDLHSLRAGTMMGKITSGGKYAPAFVGLSGEAMTGDETEMTVAAAVAVEIVRRFGAAATFTLVGPPTAAGVVRSITVTYSAINVSTGAITITAMEVTSTWTLTLAAGTDGGGFGLRITTPAGVALDIPSQAFGVTSADLETAVEALSTVGAGNGTITGDGPHTIVFDGDLGDMRVDVINDSTADGGVVEGGVIAAQTVVGVDGRFVDNCLIGDVDGSENPICFLGNGYPLKVTDQDGADIDVEFDRMLLGGIIDSSALIFAAEAWSDLDASIKTWLMAKLNGGALTTPAFGPFMFDHRF